MASTRRASAPLLLASEPVAPSPPRSSTATGARDGAHAHRIRHPTERVSGLSLGADDYLPKPFHFPELVLRIRGLARRRPAAQARIFRAAGIELDPLRHAATRLGRRLDLSAKEFAVLEALMRAQHAVLSAEDLFAQVWDENADPFTNWSARINRDHVFQSEQFGAVCEGGCVWRNSAVGTAPWRGAYSSGSSSMARSSAVPRRLGVDLCISRGAFSQAPGEEGF